MPAIARAGVRPVMGITRFIFIAAFLLSPLGKVFGSMVIAPVDATNIQTMPFVVRAEKTDYGQKIHFRVIAGRKLSNGNGGEVMDFSFEGATLSVYDGTNFISSCSVAGQKVPADMQRVTASLAESGILFEFAVSTNYLTSSRFEVAYVSGRHPAIADYRFMLKSFVDAN